MADLSKVLDGPWSPPAQKIIASPESQLRDSMRGAGLEPPTEILMDGKINFYKLIIIILRIFVNLRTTWWKVITKSRTLT